MADAPLITRAANATGCVSGIFLEYEAEVERLRGILSHVRDVERMLAEEEWGREGKNCAAKEVEDDTHE